MKTVMVFEAVRVPQSDWFYTDAQRANLRTERTIPRRTAVWLAATVNADGFYANATDMSTSPDYSMQATRGYVTTLAFGCVALQVLSIHLGDDVAADTRVTTDLAPGPWERCTLSVWPASASLAWPPALGLQGEGGLEVFHKRFRGPNSVSSDSANVE
jgi:hypothetical protein